MSCSRIIFIYESLVNHLESVFSVISEYPGYSEEVSQIVMRYPDIMDIARKNLYVLEEYLERSITEDEFIYIVIHICAAIERQKSKPVSYAVLLVCGSGIGTARLLQARLEKYFHMDVLDVISAHAIPDYDITNVDAIISTVSLSQYHVEYIQVNPMLTDEDCIRVGELLKHISVSQPKTEKVSGRHVEPVEVLQKIRTVLAAEEEDTYKVANISKLVEGYFSQEDEIMLDGLLKQEAIRFDVECGTWQDSIRASAEYLLEHEYITQNYVERMIQNVVENGPYIVFAPGFALAHESLDYGAKKLGMSLVRLKTPVPFGKEELDPVEWVCCLSAVDKEKHLKSMFQLMNLLYDEVYRERLQLCQTPAEVHRLMEQFVYEA